MKELYQKTSNERYKILIKFVLESRVVSESELSLSEQDAKMAKTNKNSNAYNLVLGCNKSGKSQVFIGEYRNAFISLGGGCSEDAFQEASVALLHSLFTNEQERFSMLNNAELTTEQEYFQMKRMKYSEEYQVIFSLFNGDPNEQLVDWEIEEAVQAFIEPLARAFEPVSSLVSSFQIQNYAQLPIKEEKMMLSDKPIYVLKQQELPHFINSAEWNLAPAVSVSPPIHFVLYIPPKQITPLHILQSNGYLLPTNAFLIPRFGGVHVFNLQQNTSEAVTLKLTEMKSVMEIFIYQLRELLGVRPFVIKNLNVREQSIPVTVASSPLTGITLWERDRLTRERTMGNMVDAISTLNSLATLITNLENMVVLDHIQTQVTESLADLNKAKQAFLINNITLAAQHARLAILSSETAFFDKTMVSLLYFPSEHIYAMYMPFFVPVAIPLIGAIVEQVKIFKALRKLKAD